MEPLYALRDSSVLYDGREDLKPQEVRCAVTNAMRRKLRLAGFASAFWVELDERGESTITWNFTRYNAQSDRHWVQFAASASNEENYRLSCVGPQAESTIERINKALADKTPKWLRRWVREEERRKRSPKRRRSKKRKAEVPRTPKQKRKRKEKRPAPPCVLSCAYLKPQYPHHRIFWWQAVELVVYAFNLPGHESYRRAWLWLFDSKERTACRFAYFKSRGFVIRFDIPDWKWRRDMTPLMVSSTKDNKHPVYRRMRAWLANNLHGLPKAEQQERKRLLHTPTIVRLVA